MQCFLLALMAFIMSNVTFAMSTGQSHVNSAMKLSQPWKDAKSQEARLDQDDLLIVYGGQDISLKTPKKSVIEG